MAINTTENGTSVYCKNDFQQKSVHPLYQAIRAWCRNYSSSTILDLGCSDLPASAELALEDRSIIGMDLCHPALTLAKKHAPQAALFMADLTDLPINDPSGRIDCVLLLDVVEHLKIHQAIGLLAILRSRLSRPLHIIVSMPIISPLSLPCIYEAIDMIRKGCRPETGLFDRTHQILANQDGHRNIFNNAGYDIEAEGYTAPQGIVGIEYPERQPAAMGRKRTGLIRFLIHHAIPTIAKTISPNGDSRAIQALTAYQGLYLLAPKTT
jgi:hypothetical protein